MEEEDDDEDEDEQTEEAELNQTMCVVKHGS